MDIHRLQQIEADEDLREICRAIVGMHSSAIEWDVDRSDPVFKRGPYEGGYNNSEQQFEFSMDKDGLRFWVAFPFMIASRIARGEEQWLDLFPHVSDLND